MLKVLYQLGILHSFWNILEHSGTIWNFLERSRHSGTFWTLDVLEGCRKVDFQVEDGQTDRWTLGLVVLRLRS